MKVTKAIIPAAGLGTRFLPITKAVPKPMLSVLDKPTIQYIVEELSEVGIKDVLIIISADSDVIEKHFGPAETLEQRLLDDGKIDLYNIEKQTQSFNVSFTVQKTANGLGGALLCAEKFIGGEPFALLLGDELMYAKKGETSCMKKLVDLYEKTGKSVLSTMTVFGDDLTKYGNVGIKDETAEYMNVSAVIEKPQINTALSNEAVMGRYVFNAELIDLLKNIKQTGSEIVMTDALDILAKQNKLIATTFEGERYDVGDKFGYIKANVEYALRSEEIGDKVKEYILELSKRL